MPDPPATKVEVENTEAATNNATEANDVVIAEANVAPAMNMVLEVNVAPEANAASEANPLPEANASSPLPPPRPHTIEQAYDHGQLVTVRYQSWFLRLLLDLSLPIMWSTCLGSRSQSQGYHGFQVLQLHQDPLI